MQEYLASSEYIDWQHPDVLACAQTLAADLQDKTLIAKTCFEFVRDEIAHSGDIESDQVTCKASEVLSAQTGWCYAKSHLLVALLRANNIPAALCYQRLIFDENDDSSAHSFHGLTSVYLDDYGWYRCDARGDKEGVITAFTPPTEKLAWLASAPGEINFKERLAAPLAATVECLYSNTTHLEMAQNLPDGTQL